MLNALSRHWSIELPTALIGASNGMRAGANRPIFPSKRLLQTAQFAKNDTKNTPFHKRFVIVDSDHFAKNKYLYRMPADAHAASQRVTSFLDVAKLEDAHLFLRALPYSYQSTVIWNQLLNHCAKTGRVNLAERYFSEMRSRGLSPNERTFSSIISSFARNDSPDIVVRAERWLQRMNEYNLQPSVYHVNALMHVYARAERPDKMVNLFNDMGNGIVPDKVTYTTLLRYYPAHMDTALLHSVWQDIEARLESKPKASNLEQGNTSLLSQKAAQITHSEEALRMQKADQQLKVDDSLVASFMFALAKSGSSKEDILFGVQIIARLYGECSPMAKQLLEKHDMTVPPQQYDLKMTSKVLGAIMRCFGTMRMHKLAEDYFQHITRTHRNFRDDPILTRTHFMNRRQMIENFKTRGPSRRR